MYPLGVGVCRNERNIKVPSISTTIRRTLLSVVAVCTLTAIPAAARDASYTVTLNQDSFFDFNPSFNGLIPVDDNMDFSF